MAGNKNRLCVSVRARSSTHLLHPSISPLYSRPIHRATIDYSAPADNTIRDSANFILSFRTARRTRRQKLGQQSTMLFTCLSRPLLVPPLLPPILFHSRLPPPPPSSSTPGVSLAWIYIATVRTRIYRETCSNAVLFFQRDPFSLFRPLYGYYAVIYRTVERSTRLAPRIDFNKNIYRILSREVLANRCRLCISSAGRIIRLISLYEYSLYVYIFFFIWNLVFLLVDKTSYVFTMNY